MLEVTKTVDINYELSKVEKNALKENEFYLPSLWKVFFARLTDLIISSLLFLILGYIFKDQAKEGNWIFLFIIFSTALIWNFSYFVLFPYLLKGKTVGKIIFKIKLVKFKVDEKIKFKDVFQRELWFIIMPWCLLYLGNILFLFLMMKYDKTKNGVYLNLGYIIYQLNYWIFMIWNVAVGLSIKLQKNHQSSVDMKNKVIVVLEKSKQIKRYPKISTKSVMQETPGKFNEEILNQIGNSEEKEFYSSIQVDKPSLTENLKLEKKSKKQIEQKEKGESHE
ncbi:hypothetical protein MENTO_v1c06130 [Mesoplasma entomophilum]|uniref:RDD domain-containing protein n=1 Tax=Mesoplasma entomophilum TaxID=2149 RepID=A0A3S5Y027_9MOLU|nr:RDD family protein [Mesoplasma entomophilum]ATQ35745.1 hypothetical protein CS528_03210 [Mesoplasma entomophilum]ATZ19714.1 hypothetical protein MENTO_v1c06130 [Mesoplasma entomophilum]